ncbi:UDP-3-O-(3-hydroxymyristoyl)glucosamine N-acyltransferase [Campylobacter sp. IFREMER_LSEM_CL1846]|uniref:UDP-3-O-(3-hydroxymyristoyl)glucosamine N-acyltransferase n=1 Tax=unclassified Campylobacter TaxID=2593542 RepID=UPI001283DEAA|nr:MULTISPECIES: UDP-3-O-(3-hydroxymyristoyl)glucosamine N-acyltransferase [unclassified Campylobacter]EAI8628603.1 UDP-3-O-(3-hydroxymyristoyl)glucosamine N-acyltransferase [Campylobacter lari]EAJ0349044.1 UDP-3-O-(3-hydroxymyristoyl)glucosamine N-acyltransferase [Campylobacter lari]EAJ5678624.1 UDP-3-O-(3-hydroxymyristoyl)glucosamine N-acyltransferase [Campylobacter lari]EAK0444312.1 UDP-3-O-(3-hydroxymyristoyl)glucosamine N-acyltransferase [Campylobacter lari]EAK9942573.1 UDP-3-O-(3-hydroxy
MKISEIAKFLGIEYCGDDIEITALNSLNNASFTELSYCDGEKNSKKITSSGAGAILVSKEFENLVSKDCVKLVVDNPHLSFALLSKLFAKPLISSEKKNSKIAKSAKIMPNVYIGENVQIADHVVIMAGAYIGDNVSIGEYTTIHPNVVIYNDTKIGKKCHLLANCVIGSDGFGYAHTKNGEHYKIYHNGNVILEDFVEVGACTTIDRAVFESTIIKQGTKIDNLVQVGHNCEVGENCLIVAQSGISGSSILGKNVTMGGQSATSGHLEIGDFATIAARGGVTKNLEGARVYGGFPIMLQKDWLKFQAKIITAFRDKHE